MALGRRTGLLLFALSSLAGCGGAPSSAAEAPAASAPAEAAATPSEPASAAESSGPSGADAQGGEAKPAAGSEEKWEGEEEAAKPGTPVARTKEETRTTAVIQETVKANRQPVRDCYDKGRKELGSDVKGSMIIKFTLDPDGKVKKAELDLKHSDIKAPAIVNCALDVIKKIKFPPSSLARETDVNYPFDFKPDGGGSGKKQ